MATSSAERVRRTLAEAAQAAAPPPDLSIVEWAERYRILGRSSRLSGPYRAIRTPFWREPMEALSPRSPVEIVIVEKAAQLGASEFGLNFLGFHLHLAPSPILAVQPTTKMAERFSRQRLQEMLTLAPELQSQIATPRGGELPSSVLLKSTRAGGLIVLTGSNSAASLRALPAKCIFLDEVDAYPGDVGGEGDPVDLAIQRAESYGTSRKILILSTPTEKGLSRIDRLYAATDRRRFYVPCPHCSNSITLEFPNLYSANGAVLYRCQVCGEPIEERDKLPLLEAGCWKPTAASADETVRGFHVSQLYSPWTMWRDLLLRHDQAKGIPEKERVFFNCALGEPWSAPALEMPAAEVLIARAEPYLEGTVPKGGTFLTAGVDCQADRLECEIVAWGRNFESWSVHYFVLYGDIAEPRVWGELEEILSRSWPHESGMPMQIQACAIDAGFSAAEVTAFTRNRHAQRIYAVKGLSLGWGKPIWPRRASWDKNKHAIYLISSDETKAWVANRMKIEAPGAGFMHVPLSRDRGWYEQLTAEKLVFQKGQRRWVNVNRARNEAFDARCLAVAALHSRLLAGVDLNSWSEQFEKLIAPRAAPPIPPKPNGPPDPPARPRFVWG